MHPEIPKCLECGWTKNPQGCVNPECPAHLDRVICTVKGCGAKAAKTEESGTMWRTYRCENGHFFKVNSSAAIPEQQQG